MEREIGVRRSADGSEARFARSSPGATKPRHTGAAGAEVTLRFRAPSVFAWALYRFEAPNVLFLSLRFGFGLEQLGFEIGG